MVQLLKVVQTKQVHPMSTPFDSDGFSSDEDDSDEDSVVLVDDNLVKNIPHPISIPTTQTLQPPKQSRNPSVVTTNITSIREPPPLTQVENLINLPADQVALLSNTPISPWSNTKPNLKLQSEQNQTQPWPVIRLEQEYHNLAPQCMGLRHGPYLYWSYDCHPNVHGKSKNLDHTSSEVLAMWTLLPIEGQTEDMKHTVAGLLNAEVKLMEHLADELITEKICAIATSLGMVVSNHHPIMNVNNLKDSLISTFTKVNWARAAIALSYQFTKGWDIAVRCDMLSKFSKPIRFLEEYNTVTHLPNHHLLSRGHKIKNNLLQLIWRRLNLTQRRLMDSVQKQVGWDFCFRRFGCINWVFGRDDQSLLPGLLQLTSIQGLTPKTWILEPNDTSPLPQVEGDIKNRLSIHC